MSPSDGSGWRSPQRDRIGFAVHNRSTGLKSCCEPRRRAFYTKQSPICVAKTHMGGLCPNNRNGLACCHRRFAGPRKDSPALFGFGQRVPISPGA